MFKMVTVDGVTYYGRITFNNMPMLRGYGTNADFNRYIVIYNDKYKGMYSINSFPKKVVKAFVEQYIKHIPNLIKPKYNTLLGSQFINLELNATQKSDLSSILQFEDTIKYPHTDLTPVDAMKIYYNKPKTGKRFTIMELANYEMPNIITDNMKFRSTTVIVTSYKTQFMWKWRLDKAFNDSYAFVVNKNSIDNFCYSDGPFPKVLIVPDNWYDRFVAFCNSSNTYFTRMVFDSVFSLDATAVKIRPKCVFSVILMSNNLNNFLIPHNNIILNTRRYYSGQLNFIGQFLVNNVNVTFESLQAILSQVTTIHLIKNNYIQNNNEFKGDYIKYILENHKDVYDEQTFNKIHEKNKINYLDNLITVMKPRHRHYSDTLQNYFVGCSNIDKDTAVYKESNTISLHPSMNPSHTIASSINDGTLNEFIMMFMDIKPLEEIIKKYDLNGNKDAIVERITQRECMICFTETDTDVISDCCDNKFCASCYLTAIKDNMKCPMCRSTVDISKLVVSAPELLKLDNPFKNNLETLEYLVDNSNKFSRTDLFKKVIKHIKKTEPHPKIIICFTDYIYNRWSLKSRPNKGEYKNSVEYNSIMEVLKENDLNSFELLGNPKQLARDYMLFNSPDSDFYDVMIHNNNSHNIDITDTGLDFSSVNNIIYFNDFDGGSRMGTPSYVPHVIPKMQLNRHLHILKKNQDTKDSVNTYYLSNC